MRLATFVFCLLALVPATEADAAAGSPSCLDPGVTEVAALQPWLKAYQAAYGARIKVVVARADIPVKGKASKMEILCSLPDARNDELARRAVASWEFDPQRSDLKLAQDLRGKLIVLDFMLKDFDPDSCEELPLSFERRIKLPSSAVIDEGELYPRKRVAPRYPAAANKKSREGRVLLSYSISQAGGVTRPEIDCASSEEFNDVRLLKILRQWRFPPVGEDTTDNRFRLQIDFNINSFGP